MTLYLWDVTALEYYYTLTGVSAVANTPEEARQLLMNRVWDHIDCTCEQDDVFVDDAIPLTVEDINKRVALFAEEISIEPQIIDPPIIWSC